MVEEREEETETETITFGGYGAAVRSSLRRQHGEEDSARWAKEVERDVVLEILEKFCE